MGLHLSNEGSSSIFQPLLWKLSDFKWNGKVRCHISIDKMHCDLQSQQFTWNVLEKLVFLLHPIIYISHIYPTYPTNNNKKLCPVFYFQFFCPSQTLLNFFLPPLNFVQLTQLLTLALLFRLHMCLSCDAAFLHLKKCSMISFQRNIIIDINNWHLFKM